MMPEESAHTKEKRVLLSGHLPPPMGGIAAFYQSLLSSSLSQKVDMEFVVTSSQKRPLSDSGKATFSNLVAAIQDLERFSNAVKKHKPQITHIATAPGLSFLKHSICALMARAQGSKVLIHPHCSLKVLYHERPGQWRWFVDNILRRTDGLIALSKEWEEVAEIIPGHPVFLLPNALDMRDYRAIAKNRLSQNNPKDTVSILYLGYIGKAKGSFDLIEAAGMVLQDHTNVTFHLIGDELSRGERNLLNQSVRAAGLEEKLIIHQPVYEGEKLKAFQDADIFVYPSYHEGMPMAVIEAMASALPVVASSVGGLPDLIREGENGMLVPAGDPTAVAAALIRLIEDPELRFSMQQASYRIAVEQYDIERLVDELLQIYEKF